MPVYNGNTKQGTLYYGGSKIKEAYYEGTKVYVSEPLARCYKQTNQNAWFYVLKGQSVGTNLYAPGGDWRRHDATSVSQLSMVSNRVIVSYNEETLIFLMVGNNQTCLRQSQYDLYQ